MTAATAAGDAVMAAGKLVLLLGEQDRVTRHADGRLETVTTHTVMLGIVACALAQHIDELDVGLVAQYALVHDLVEAYAGDTSTLKILTPAQAAAKENREAAAAQRILLEFADTLPWIPARLASYNRQQRREARFVRAVDKLLPKILHLVNQCMTLRAEGVDPDEVRARYRLQVDELYAYSAEWPIIAELHTDLVGRVLAMCGATFDEAAAR